MQDDEYNYYEESNPPEENELQDENQLQDEGIEDYDYLIEKDTGPEFVAEAKIFERVTGRGITLGGDISGSSRLKDIQKIANRESLTETEKYSVILNTYFNNFRDSGLISFPDNEIRGIFSLINKIKTLKYKNPLGIIFGYYVLDKNKDISKEKFNLFVKNIYPKLEEGIIALPDVIRYARFIKKIS